MDKIFNNIIDSWKKSYLNHIFIENKENEVFVINSKDNIHKTYYFENSKNLIIHITTKINHLVINKCTNIRLNINSSLISGLDIFHSNDVIINNNYETQSNYSVSFGQNIVFNNNKITDKMNISLCTTLVYNLKINKKYNSSKNYINFIGCMNLFRTEPIYFFINNSLEKIHGIDTEYGKFTIKKI